MYKYKDAQGRFLTRALFKETSDLMSRKKFSPEFTLKEHDITGYKSMRALYLSFDDPTEYKFAIEVLGSWDHWQKLSNCSWFKEDYLDAWRFELEIKLRSQGIVTMKDLATTDKNKDAAKWLAQGGWSTTTTAPKRGRPTNEEVKGERKIQARMKQDIEDDAARLGISIVPQVK